MEIKGPIVQFAYALITASGGVPAAVIAFQGREAASFVAGDDLMDLHPSLRSEFLEARFLVEIITEGIEAADPEDRQVPWVAEHNPEIGKSVIQVSKPFTGQVYERGLGYTIREGRMFTASSLEMNLKGQWSKIVTAHKESIRQNAQMGLEGLARIWQERSSQLNDHQRTPPLDARAYPDGILSLAAACYAVEGVVLPGNAPAKVACALTGADAWPWGADADNRQEHSRIKRLEVAGALIAAEIDRLLLDQASEALVIEL